MSPLHEARFEVIPFPAAEEQATRLPEPVRLAVTASPRHGVDHTLGYGVRLRALGHRVTLHVAARMVRDGAHLQAILERAAEAEIDDLFVIGGDAPVPLGPYESAGDLLELLAEHPLRPAAVGIGAYPEGHPLIDDETLGAALLHKAPLATYMVTQLCFDATVLWSWLDELRANGVTLPLYVGAPGPIDRRRLLDISLRVGVGPSVRFIRKQHGLTRLLRSPVDSATRFYAEIAPHLQDPRRGVKGFHFFTFNELLSTWGWLEERRRTAAG